MGEQEMFNELVEEGIEVPAVPSEASTAQGSGGMLDTIKEKLNINVLMEKARHSKDKFLEAGLYAGIGFISGFLLKKYSTYVLACALVLIGLGVLQHLEVINVMVNWDKVTELFGIQAAQTVTADSIIATVWEWVKLNMLISVSYLVGLFIGLKVG